VTPNTKERSHSGQAALQTPLPRRRSVETATRFRAPTPPVPFPLQLQRRAARSERSHNYRSARRVAVLLASDIAVFLGLRALFHLLARADASSAFVRRAFEILIPPGEIPPVQLGIAILLGLAVCGCYGEGDHRRDPGQLLGGVTLGVALGSWQTLWSLRSPGVFVGMVLALLGIWLALFAGRLVVNAAAREACRRFGWGARVLVVGAAHADRSALELPMFGDPTEMRAVGYLDVAPTRGGDADGALDALAEALANQRIDTVLICGGVESETARYLVDIADAAGCQVLVIPNYFDDPGVEPEVVWRHGSAVVQITRPGSAWRQRTAKRVFDMVASAIALLVFAPVLVVIAIAVKLTSPGPVLFRQTRVGRGGRPFSIYKFRSMVREAETMQKELENVSIYTDARLFKVKDDPRITSLGAFLRRTSLDELPQLWNVFRGEMSIVGPRPPVPSEVALYADHHYTRFDVRPGITGPWQVGGRNNITDFEEVIRLEKSYIRHWTLWKDLAILLRTIPAVLRMDGAH
jgi:exopolysaccharide biosynthesis polyprenyl glycosylphosphotransferase